MAQNDLETSIRLVDDKVRFETMNRTDTLAIDLPPPYGDSQGYTPLDLFLTSFAACTATSLLTLMRDRMRKTIVGMTMRAVGTPKAEHPKAFSLIHLNIALISPDATEEEVLRALDSVERMICPIAAMIRGNVRVTTTIDLKRAAEGPGKTPS